MNPEFVPGKRNYKIGRCEFHRELVLKMASEGAFLNEIARKIGTSGPKVSQFLRRNGVAHKFPTAKKGEKCVAYKRGWTKTWDGYILILSRGHPRASKHTHYVPEHRLVMEKMIGRYLLPEEVVHHKDGNRSNNKPENLQLFSENSEHLKFELTGRVPQWSEQGRENIRKANLLRKSQKVDDTLKA